MFRKVEEIPVNSNSILCIHGNFKDKGCSKIKFTNLNGPIASIISPILNIFASQKFPVFPAF